jgi:hypothetical protein
VKRWALLLPVIFVAGLFAAFHATAATKVSKDTNASSQIVNVGGGQFKWNVTQLSPDTMIDTFTLMSAPGFTPTSVVSVSDAAGSCTVSGKNVQCHDSLMLAPCMCQPGGSVDIVLQATGDPTGSTLAVNGASFPVQATGGGYTPPTTTTQTTTTTPTPTTTTTKTTPTPPKKVVPKCKKGQKSTKKKPCRK